MREETVGEPEFSVIIPAYNVQGYLRQAVMSVAFDPAVEVLVVDDRSTDGTGALVDELASQFPTVTALRPEHNVGLGRARNLGLEHARGKYVLFVDGDDYLTPDAFDQLRAAIYGTEPDIVMFGYKRLYPNGDAIDGTLRAPLQIEGAFTAAERPEIFDVLNVAWNKAYRREFLSQTGIEFPVGYYEDIPWTYPLLAVAKSIVGLDEPLYLYRQRWSGSILRSTNARHLEIIDQFERLMDVMDTLELSDELQREIFTRAYRNLVTLATSMRHRLPHTRRQEYYERAQKIARERVPNGYVLPTEGDKWQLMHAMWDREYPSFMHQRRITTALLKTRSVIVRTLRTMVRMLRAPFNRRWSYEFHRRYTHIKPNLVVLETLWGRTPRLNALAVEAEIKRTHPQMKTVWAVKPEDAPAVLDGFDVVVKGTRDYYRALATAKYFFLDVNLPGWWRKRKGQVFTQLHHGTPLKLMGVEERGQTREWKDGLLRRCQHWDFSLVANAYSAEVWKHSYPVNCETLEYGYPRNDILINADARASKEARARLGIDEGARVVLYAPTFREADKGSGRVGHFADVAAALGENDVLLLRGHYFAKGEALVHTDAKILDVTDHASIEELFLAADVLVTDYSSAMFDYANLRRPIVIFAYDWEQYVRERGTYFDLTVDSPGPVARSGAELATVMEERAYESPENMQRLERFADIFGCFETGRAAQDIVARVIDGVTPTPPPRGGLPALHSWNMDRVA